MSNTYPCHGDTVELPMAKPYAATNVRVRKYVIFRACPVQTCGKRYRISVSGSSRPDKYEWVEI